MVAHYKKVKTLYIPVEALVLASTGSEWENSAFSYVWQDNIKIIAAQLMSEILVNDTASNTDGVAHCIVELSRNGKHGQDGAFLLNGQFHVWNGVIALGGGLRKLTQIVYPADYGMDFDEGDSTHMHLFMETTSVASISLYAEGIIHYVER